MPKTTFSSELACGNLSGQHAMRHALAQTTCRTSMLHVRPARPQSISVQLHATSKAWGRRWWSCEAKYSSAQNSKPRSSHFLAEQHNVAWSSGRRNLESRIQADESRCCHRGWNNVLGARTFHSGTGMRTNERADIQRFVFPASYYGLN